MLRGELQIDAINSNFKNFESALCMKSVSMSLSYAHILKIVHAFQVIATNITNIIASMQTNGPNWEIFIFYKSRKIEDATCNSSHC